MTHLWEAKHDYYCNEGNYYSNDCTTKCKSWADFVADMGDADMDLNLLFRWDWTWASEDEDGEPVISPDPYCRDGRLQLCYIGQRKGIYSSWLVDVCKADEPAVVEFLKPRLAHLVKLWEPLLAERAVEGGAK